MGKNAKLDMKYIFLKVNKSTWNAFADGPRYLYILLNCRLWHSMSWFGVEWGEFYFNPLSGIFHGVSPAGILHDIHFYFAFFTRLLGSLHRRYAIDILCCEMPNSLSRCLDFVGGLIGNYRHLLVVYIEVECATSLCFSVIYTRELVTVRGTSW